jgi:hypothetical protein
MRTFSACALAAAVGGMLGIGLDAATVLVANSGPVGDTWSFRGNGALVVPVGFGAALLAGGWLGPFLYARGVRAWALFTIAVTAAAAAPAALSIVVLVVFGGWAQGLSDLMTLPVLVFPVLSLVCGAIVDFRPAPSRRLPHASAILTALVFGIAMGAGFFGAESVVATGSG